MTRITRAEAELDAKQDQLERKQREAELRGQGVQPPKPDDTQPKTPLGWVAYTIGSICLITFFLCFYYLILFAIQ